MKPYTIRVAIDNDIDTITAFNLRMAEETEGRRLDPARLRLGVAAVLSDKAKGVYYIAETDGTPLGQLLVTYEWSDWRNGMFWWIQSVYVRADARSQGVFRALYEHVLEMAGRGPDVCGIRLYVDGHNTVAQGVYRNLGMKKSEYQLLEVDFVL